MRGAVTSDQFQAFGKIDTSLTADAVEALANGFGDCGRQAFPCEFGKLLGESTSLFVFGVHADEFFSRQFWGKLSKQSLPPPFYLFGLLGPVALAEPHARVVTILVDEFDTGFFKSNGRQLFAAFSNADTPEFETVTTAPRGIDRPA